MPNSNSRKDIFIDSWTHLTLKYDFRKDSQVIVHLTLRTKGFSTKIQISKHVQLVTDVHARSGQLVHFNNIELHPNWQVIPPHTEHTFTLIFNGFPRRCKVFSLMESNPESGGFRFINIPRNKDDVYYLNWL